jgi:hypothetical protein
MLDNRREKGTEAEKGLLGAVQLKHLKLHSCQAFLTCWRLLDGSLALTHTRLPSLIRNFMPTLSTSSIAMLMNWAALSRTPLITHITKVGDGALPVTLLILIELPFSLYCS